MGAVLLLGSLEAGKIDDRERVGDAVVFARLGRQQHGADEQVVPGVLRDDAHRDAVLGIRADERVEDEDLAVLEELLHLLEDAVELLLRERLVHLAPPHALVGGGIADDEFVVRRATGVLSGEDHQRPAERDFPLSAPDRFLEEHGGGKVPVRLLHTDGTDLVSRFGHCDSPVSAGRWK